MIVYTTLGYFPVLRRKLSKEFKRLGFNSLKEKRWFLAKVLGYAPNFKEMSIAEMERVIDELTKYENVNEII
ncbi:hypothetical protein MOF52_16920 [Bacillus inaquosorum]|nr:MULTISPECIES: hypothetical protein [Bacillus subtilis group]MCA1214829.1 hypothetical protein [Bacillus amyloliquefaciens]ASS60735.1 hypothetical protein CHN56_00190 [Bacillus velezensis]MCY7943818.1 hypothetical protein [Bacillus inaquosorum]MCY9409663.1 hypothetical protein [Bacillus inaquosorum]MCY9418476.1 hypothetical protein [Bacillus inaquosorum]